MSAGEKMQIEAIDREQLGEISGGDREFELELAKEFLVTASKLMSDLQSLLKSKKHDEIKRLAHTLKGSSQTFGAKLLAEAARSLETIAGARNSKSYFDAMAIVSAEADRIFKYIEAEWGVKGWHESTNR